MATNTSVQGLGRVHMQARTFTCEHTPPTIKQTPAHTKGLVRVWTVAVRSSATQQHRQAPPGRAGGGARGARLGFSRPTVHTATVVHTKQRTATLRDQCVHASSMLNSTPPMGAPNAAWPAGAHAWAYAGCLVGCVRAYIQGVRRARVSFRYSFSEPTRVTRLWQVGVASLLSSRRVSDMTGPAFELVQSPGPPQPDPALNCAGGRAPPGRPPRRPR